MGRDHGRWRSEERKQALTAVARILLWQVGLVSLRAEEVKELRDDWEGPPHLGGRGKPYQRKYVGAHREGEGPVAEAHVRVYGQGRRAVQVVAPGARRALTYMVECEVRDGGARVSVRATSAKAEGGGIARRLALVVRRAMELDAWVAARLEEGDLVEISLPSLNTPFAVSGERPPLGQTLTPMLTCQVTKLPLYRYQRSGV